MTLILNIYLVKSDITKMVNVLTEEYRDGLIQDMEIEGVEKSILCIKDPIVIDPDWYKFFKDHLDPEMLPKTKTSPSGVLLIKNNDAVFALTFGHGRFMINTSATLPDFGLKVCLNSLASDKIKTVDTRALEQLTMHTKKQAVIPLDFNAFEVETDRDMMRSVEGYFIDDDGKERYLKGSSSLSIRTDVNLNQISKLCSKFIKIYYKDTYKEEFGWIDNVKLISDQTQKDSLDKKILELIESNKLKEIFLGAPEIVDDIKISDFRFSHFSRSENFKLFPTINAYIANYKKVFAYDNTKKDYAKFSIEQLKLHKVKALEAVDDKKKEVCSWAVYDCLCAEIKEKSSVFKLIEGNWYEIDTDYLNGVEAAISKITNSKLALPNMNLGENEEDYNIRAATEIKAVCMDQDFVYIKGRSKFEFCDIFTKDKHIVHVKKHTGAPAISHLLYQAYVSGIIFSSEPKIRQAISKKKKISDQHCSTKVNPSVYSSSDYEIVIGIATRKKEGLDKILTFFSKISLAHKYRVLKARGYNVSVKVILIV